MTSTDYLIEETDAYRITDPSGIGITYRVVAKSDGRIIGECVSLPAARELGRSASNA